MNTDATVIEPRIDFSGKDFASAVDVVDALLASASRLRASDVHLDPSPQGISVRMRIDGELDCFGMIGKGLHEEIIARLKILSGARTDIHAVPQDGRYRVDISGMAYNVRLSFMPTYHGENVVVRLLPATHDGIDSFAALGFTPSHTAMLERALALPHGLILVTGPTGSGKTTTLRVCLGIKAAEPLSVMTLEDPVEFEVPRVRHVHIRETYGVSFASGLRSALRQDPDVIMVGEIRDEETARTAVTTALTGHLVLSTLHTNSAIETILRLGHMGIERYLVAETLRLVVSQRLVRIVCRECDGDPVCTHCQGSGFRGRSVIAEVLEVDDGIRNLILRGESSRVIHEYAVSRGFCPMNEDADEKVEWGMTTRSEIVRALHS